MSFPRKFTGNLSVRPVRRPAPGPRWRHCWVTSWLGTGADSRRVRTRRPRGTKSPTALRGSARGNRRTARPRASPAARFVRGGW
ncbi:hypothetical protein FRUB_04606 [Fimbriiglobus ruber]|uniref:Uncharacterized protein n=1 Tax=Fimbriiglobus ruber TaxID=1908690 RepID=A0A225DJV2_9BACT|nr:hypothetical protein FRUB_04606 [Fimbriiglobus ruber]